MSPADRLAGAVLVSRGSADFHAGKFSPCRNSLLSAAMAREQAMLHDPDSELHAS